MATVNKETIGLSLYWLAVAIVTMLPTGGSEISGLEVSMPLICISLLILFSRSKSNLTSKISRNVLVSFMLWALWIFIGIAYNYIFFNGDVSYVVSLLRMVRLLEMYIPGILLLCLLPGINEGFYRTHSNIFILLFLLVTIEATLGFLSQNELFTATQMYKYVGMGYVYRAGGVAKDSSAFGSLIIILGMTCLILSQEMKKGSIYTLMVVFLVIVNIYTSMSRSIFVSYAVFIILSLFYSRKVKRVYLVMVALLFAIIGFLSVNNAYISILLDRIIGSDQGDISSGRFLSWIKLLDIFTTSPVFGIGYKLTIDKYGIAPDNVFLSSLVETGFVGFLLLLSFVFCVMRYCYYNNKKMIPMVVAFFTSGFFVDISTFWLSIPLLFLCIVSYRNEYDALRLRAE